MLLIECPWCGPREQSEFSYGGEAHIARPADTDALTDAQWGDYLFMRKNPRGRAPRAVAARVRLPALVQRAPRHGQLPDHAPCTSRGNRRLSAAGPSQGASCAPSGGSAAAALADAAASVGAHEPDLSPARRRAHRPPHAARVHLQRQALRGPRRRHAGLRAARQRRRRGRAELQVSPAARHRRLRRGGAQRDRAAGSRRRHGAERARDRGGALRRPRREQRERVAERRFRRAGVHGPRRALHAGRFLLQDVHVAEVVLDEVRAPHPQGVRSRHVPVRARPRPLRQDERPLRRAGRGRGPRRARRGAGRRARPARASSWPTSRASSAAACLRIATSLPSPRTRRPMARSTARCPWRG